MSRLLSRRSRRDSGIQWRLHKPVWVDPTPWIQGTHVEKMLLAELRERNIFFDFQILLTEIVPEARGYPVLAMHPYRADFYLPSIHAVLDPWDDYHHSLPDQAQADWEKLSVYQAFGIKTYHWWASDIEKNGAAWALNQIPNLPSRGHGGFKLYHTQDDTAGIAAANTARAIHKAPELRRRVRRGRRTS